MTTARIGVVLAAFLLAGSVEAQSTRSDYDAKTDFTQYRTFSLQPGTAAPTPFAQERIEKAVAAQLEARGMTAAADAGSADLVAHTHVRISSQTVVDFDTFGYAGYYHPWGMGTSTATVREIPVGALMVDLVDANGKKVVWRGVVEGTLSSNPTPEKSEKRINKAVAKLFKKYPVPVKPKK